MQEMIIEVQEDEDGELFLEFDPTMLSQMGWHEGDILEWTVEENGTVVIEKKEVSDEQEG